MTQEQLIALLIRMVALLEATVAAPTGGGMFDHVNSPPSPVVIPARVWLKAPYYVPGREEFVEATSISGIASLVISLKSYLEKALAGSLSNAGGFLDGSKFYTTPETLVGGWELTAQQHVAAYPSLGAGMTADEVTALGKKFGDLEVSLLKQIPASVANGVQPADKSVYEVWTAGK